MSAQPVSSVRIPEPTLPAQPSRMAAMLPTIVVGGVVLGLIVLVVYLLWAHRPAGVEPPEAKTVLDGQRRPLIVKLAPITVNMKGSPRRYLRASLGLETSSPLVADELQRGNAPVSDFLIDILSNVEVNEVDNTAGRNKLKRDILKGMNELLEGGSVNNVYFVEFIIQTQ